MLEYIRLTVRTRSTYYFSTHGCNLASFLEPPVDFDAVSFAVFACRALRLKKSAIFPLPDRADSGLLLMLKFGVAGNVKVKWWTRDAN
jgi:hypothetical protein